MKKRNTKNIDNSKEHIEKINKILELLNISPNNQPLDENNTFENDEPKEENKVNIGIKYKYDINLEEKRKYEKIIFEEIDKDIDEISNEQKLESKPYREKGSINNLNEKDIPKAIYKESNNTEDTNKKSVENIENKNEEILDVKNKVFNINHIIEDTIIYGGKIFVKEKRKTQKYPNKINYRCKNKRKNEHKRNSNFCSALVKRIKVKNYVVYDLIKPHSNECMELIDNGLEPYSNIISNYNDFQEKCYRYLDTCEIYNKKEFKLKLLELYNNNKYSFQLKENTINNLISRWKKNSFKFTKFNAIMNRKNKYDQIILWEYSTPIIYLSNKKFPLESEFFIWTYNSIISRIRQSEHWMIDATYHHPKEYSQLLIILFKDIIISEMIPGFYILMSNKSEYLYAIIFKSIIRIITQNNKYNFRLNTITSDSEQSLINSINPFWHV